MRPVCSREEDRGEPSDRRLLRVSEVWNTFDDLNHLPRPASDLGIRSDPCRRDHHRQLRDGGLLVSADDERHVDSTQQLRMIGRCAEPDCRYEPERLPVDGRQQLNADVQADRRSCVLESCSPATPEIRIMQRLEQAALPTDVLIEDSEGFVVVADFRQPRVGGRYLAASEPATAASTARVFGSDAGMVLNFVKPDKTADFEAIVGRLREALQKSDRPGRKQQAASWKVFRAVEPGANGSVLYVFDIDPAVKGADYTISTILAEAFPTEVQALYKQYADA